MAKKTKIDSRFRCSECGYGSSSWAGRCPGCGAWGAFIEVAEESPVSRGRSGPVVRPISLQDVTSPVRLPSGMDELDRVLGGGWVPGGVVLLGGEPGIGKSTLLLQVCAALASENRSVLYISGEESASQVALRARRLGASTENLHLVCDERITGALESMGDYAFVVVDSVQALRADGEDGWPGTPSQVRAVAQECIEKAKLLGVPCVLVGHITKQGNLAGPKMLEHMVDVVLLFSGERTSSHRILRAVKNRYGSVDEAGIFDMGDRGLIPVADPGHLFWNSGTEPASGVALTVALEGTRPLVTEVQALACPTPFQYPKRTSSGIEVNRLHLLLAVLEKRCGLSCRNSDVYVNVAGGFQIRDTGADLALCMALASSNLDISLESGCCFLGEVGLAGEIRPTGRAGQRVREARRMGFSRVVLSVGEKDDFPRGIEVVRVGELRRALEVMRR